MSKETTVVIIAIVAALGLLGVLVIETISMPQQQVDARGCNRGVPYNASQGRCFNH
jgi:Flp pilus assembly protein CpaB